MYKGIKLNARIKTFQDTVSVHCVWIAEQVSSKKGSFTRVNLSIHCKFLFCGCMCLGVCVLSYLPVWFRVLIGFGLFQILAVA